MRESVDVQVSAIRAFNRFYTRKIGVVDGIASSPFSLAEARVLYELAHREQPTATDIRKELGLDAGYVSRILREFERRKFVTREQSKTDEREKFLSLTAKGRRAFAPLDARSDRDVAAILEELSPAERKRLVDAVQTAHSLLGDQPAPKTPYWLRPHQPAHIARIASRKPSPEREERAQLAELSPSQIQSSVTNVTRFAADWRILGMSEVRVSAFAVSLDGYSAGPRQSLDNPLGVRGPELFEWFFSTRTWKQMHGQEGGSTGIDNEWARRGRRTSARGFLVGTCSDLCVAPGRMTRGKGGGARNR